MTVMSSVVSAMMCERILEYVLSCVGKVTHAVLTSGEQNPLEIENTKTSLQDCGLTLCAPCMINKCPIISEVWS